MKLNHYTFALFKEEKEMESKLNHYTFAFFKEEKEMESPVYGHQELGGKYGVGSFTHSLEDLAKSVYKKMITDKEHNSFFYNNNNAEHTMNVIGGKKTNLTKEEFSIFSRELDKVTENHYKKLNDILKK